MPAMDMSEIHVERKEVDEEGRPACIEVRGWPSDIEAVERFANDLDSISFMTRNRIDQRRLTTYRGVRDEEIALLIQGSPDLLVRVRACIEAGLFDEPTQLRKL